MNRKTLFQVFLIFLVLVISSIFYYKYFANSDIKKISEKKPKSEIPKSTVAKGNTIKEISYESIDNNGNSYIINSDFGTFKETNKEEILMTNVSAKIIFKNGTNVNLQSRQAKYNTINSNTNFFDDVELKYLTHLVNSDNIDVFFTESKLTAYNNLVYKNSEINMIADKIELDLLTKNSKIFMFDNSKVKIIKD